MTTNTENAQTEAGQDALSRRLNKLIGALSGRDDLILQCAWNKGRLPGQPDAPAWFDPATNVITIKMEDAIGDISPWSVNPLTPEGRKASPKLMGMVCHEASHAHSTSWEDRVEAPAKVWQVATLLEEPRIEGRHLDRRPQDRLYLRASSMSIVIKPVTDPENTEQAQLHDRWSAASAAILGVGRMEAGVLDEVDLADLIPLIEIGLGDDYTAAVELIREAVALEDGDQAGLLDVAQRMVDLLGEPPAMPSPQCGHGDSGEGSGEDDTNESEGSGSALQDALQDALDKAAESASEEAVAELQDEEDTSAADEQVAKAKLKENDIAAQDEAKKTAEKTFPAHGATNSGSNNLGVPRPPTDAERKLANQIATTLRRAQFRDRSVTVRRNEVPPGRVNGRDAMLGSAQRSMKQVITARPFKTTIRRHVPEPPLTVGVMCDVSGSMSWSTEVMSSTAWAFAQAVYSIHGRTATVAFGRDVKPVVAPGVPPVNVTPFYANDGWENFRDGFAAVDGALNLTCGQGVRILVVVSDGHYGGDGQRKACDNAVARMVRNGGYVLWVALEKAGYGTSPSIPKGAIPVLFGGKGSRVSDLPAALTAALTSALKRG